MWPMTVCDPSARLPRYATIAQSSNKLERTGIRRHVRAASAPFHYAHAARWTRGRAAAQLRRYSSL
jgi:hypothetical protein